VLGPVEVRASGRTVDLPPLVRALVAVLAAHAGRSVSVDRLADALWDGRPPPSFRNRVQAAVSTLRRSLTAVGVNQQPILTTPSGYALDSDRSVVDAAQFGALVDTAREHLASGEPEMAIHTYRNALALWRGDAFDGVTMGGIGAEAARLDELRLGAVEECIEAELATGQHANAVVELTCLVAQHPLRERLRGQLMLCLYRSGREAEALAVYRSGYGRVTAELGVEPGADLQALHHAILTRQPRLLSSAGPATAAFPHEYLVPSQMPMSVPDFTGRRAEMTALHAHLVTRVDGAAAPPLVVVIAGMGGVGKTTLAVRAARQASGAFPGGGLFADLRGTTNEPADPHDVLGSFLRALGVQAQRVPTDPEERIGLYRSMTATRRVLVVLDDAAAEAQVRPLIPAGDGCAAIVTARSLLLGLEGSVWIPLDALPNPDGVELLAAVAGRDRVSDPDLAEHVVRLTCFHVGPQGWDL
jgi:DNA-binding SARP family transcriptional activator